MELLPECALIEPTEMASMYLLWESRFDLVCFFHKSIFEYVYTEFSTLIYVLEIEMS